MGPDIDARRTAAATPVSRDPGLVKLVEALAIERARREHAAELAARRQLQDQTADAPRSDLQPLQF